MRERPILFNGDMIRAILAGRKTQTRRPVVPTQSRPKVPPVEMYPWIIDGEQEVDDGGLPCWSGTHPDYPTGEKWFSCPLGGVGDLLWVRETWAIDAPLDQVKREYEDMMGGIGHGPYFRADGVHENTGLTWRPSVHMPKWASRILLEISAVRVERLHRIGEVSARLEGVDPEWVVSVERGESYQSYCAAFVRLWDTIYKRRGLGWSSNPWVWVISFQVAARRGGREP